MALLSPRNHRLRRVFFVLLCLTLALVAFPVSAATKHRSGTVAEGTRWATPYYVQQSDTPGPVVVIVGGIHGDEPAGAYAAEEIRYWPIIRGTLVVLPRANPPALDARKRLIPNVDQAIRNLNRNFPKAGESDLPRGEAAQAIWQWVKAQKPSWLVDLHEGGGFHVAGDKSVGSSVIAAHTPELDRVASLLLETINRTIEEPKKKFDRLSAPVNGSLARAGFEHLHIPAMIVETTMKEQALSKRIRQHRMMVHGLLEHLKMIDASVVVDRVTDIRAASGHTWVALYDAGGSGGRGISRFEVILGKCKDWHVVHVGPEEIKASLDQFDLLIIPGGSGSKESAAIGPEGRERIRLFVENGGGYLSACAGSYLATSGFSWGLKILNAQTVSDKWTRGHAMLKMELTEEGRKILGDRPGLLDVRYANGPILMPAKSLSLSPYETLAVFRTEVAEHGSPKGIQVGSPAAAAGRYGQGRVLCFSPHPEQTADLEDLVVRAAQWVARKQGGNVEAGH